MLKQKIAALTAVCMMLGSIVCEASVLGNLTGSWYNVLAPDTSFYSNTFMSENEKVGQQQEYYCEYKPNKQVMPVVVNGDKIYGKRTILQAAEYMRQNNLKPLIGINGDYFSFKTGVPMGHTIINGNLVTKDETGQNAVGFDSDGRGFISWLQIVSTMKSDSASMTVDCINKWCQPGAVPSYLVTDEFGKETKTASECIFTVFTVEDGSLAIGKSITLKVEDRFVYNGSVAIPEGKLVLCLDNAFAKQEYRDFVNNLQIGQTVTVENSAVYDAELWNNAKNGIGSIGGRLIENGVVNSNFEAGTAPRTAIGIKADGNVIFYVIDGRQSGYSYGVQIKTLAKRMAELGCVDAINLDGGGSTVVAGELDGGSGFSILNKPSDGTLRSCANYIFLQDNRIPTGIPGEISGNFKSNNNYLSGAAESLKDVYVVDTAGFKMDYEPVTYSVENTYSAVSTVDENGWVSLSGQGETIVTMRSGELERKLSLFVYTTPDDILVYETGNVNEITEYNFKTGESFSADLTVDAYLNSAFLIAEDYNFEWSIEGDIGTITNDGVFTLKSNHAAEGAIVVSAGGYEHRVPVKITGEDVQQNAFADTAGHWAQYDINRLYDKGIINGFEENGALYFKPEEKINRIQFAVMVCSMMGIKSEDYESEAFDFADAEVFSDWMKNYAKAAYSLGFINGRETENGISFDPLSPITRAEAMTILYRLRLDTQEHETTWFADYDDIPEWARKAVDALCARGIVSGYEDNTLKPAGNVKRAEAAAMICRYIEKN